MVFVNKSKTDVFDVNQIRDELGIFDYDQRASVLFGVVTTHRNDSDIKSDIVAELKWDPQVKEKYKITAALHRHATIEAGKVHVAMRDGVVTLSGQVDSYAQLDMVEDAAWAVPGVTQVIDTISIGSRFAQAG